MEELARATVSLSYPVVFTRDAFACANPTLVQAIARREPARRHRALFVVDGGLSEAVPTLLASIADYVDAYDDRLQLSGPPLVVVGGEAAKNDPKVLHTVISALHEARLDRHSCVVAVGGGAVLDMVGYAAAITHRGLRLVRIPSTVLAQADSGVGVKNGVNAFGKKNFLGTFAAPFAVVADLALLDALPARERIAGAAEAVKVALLRDPSFFDWISRRAAAIARGEPGDVAELVRKSAALHLDHIAHCGDPFEQGSARPLDFGHWAAHKLESLTRHRLRHGEGVGMGIALDMLYARAIGLSSDLCVDAVFKALRGLGLPLWDRALGDRDVSGEPRILAGLDEFREHLGGELTITLVRAPGAPFDVNAMDRTRVAASLERLRVEARCA